MTWFLADKSQMHTAGRTFYYICQFPTFIHIGFFVDRNMLSSVSVLLQGRRIEMFF